MQIKNWAAIFCLYGGATCWNRLPKDLKEPVNPGTFMKRILKDPFTKQALNGKNILEITELEPRMVLHCFELLQQNFEKPSLLPSNVYSASCFNAYGVMCRFLAV